jgi:hypothetical protein
MGDGNNFKTLQPVQLFGQQLGNHGLVFNQDAAQQGLLGPTREWQHRNRGQRTAEANRPKPFWMLTDSQKTCVALLIIQAQNRQDAKRLTVC